MRKLVQIVPLGWEQDRAKALFKRFPPHKVIFIKSRRDSEFAIHHQKEVKALQKVEDYLRSLVPLADIPETKETNEEDFFETFTLLLKIMLEEKELGNDVIVNVAGGSRILTCCAIFACSIANCKAYYLVAAEYRPSDEDLLVKGTVGEPIEIPLLPIRPPKRAGAQILLYLLNQGGKVDKKLHFIVKEIGLKDLGLKSVQSGVVTISKSLKNLEEDSFVNIVRTTSRYLKIELTETGKLMAYVVMAINKVVKNK